MMGHHLTPEQEFTSDKYAWCPTGFLALKFTDPLAWAPLLLYAVSAHHNAGDTELAADIALAVRRAMIVAREYDGGVCRHCGCTVQTPCRNPLRVSACAWVDGSEDVCTFCAAEALADAGILPSGASQ